MAKGIMFSLGFFFLASLLLVVGMLTLLSSQETEYRAIEAGILIKITDFDSSLEKAVKDTFQAQSTTLFTVDNFSVNIVQPLPGNLSSLNTSLNELKTLVEGDESAIILNNSNFHLYTIKPYNFNYSQDENNLSYINLNPETENYNAYQFEFDVGNSALGNIDFASYTAGSFPITVITKNDTNSINETQNVLITADVEINLQNIETEEIEIDITNQNVQIFNNLSFSVATNMTVTFIGDETPRVEYPSFIFMMFEGFNISKISSVSLTS